MCPRRAGRAWGAALPTLCRARSCPARCAHVPVPSTKHTSSSVRHVPKARRRNSWRQLQNRSTPRQRTRLVSKLMTTGAQQLSTKCDRKPSPHRAAPCPSSSPGRGEAGAQAPGCQDLAFSRQEPRKHTGKPNPRHARGFVLLLPPSELLRARGHVGAQPQLPALGFALQAEEVTADEGSALAFGCFNVLPSHPTPNTSTNRSCRGCLAGKRLPSASGEAATRAQLGATEPAASSGASPRSPGPPRPAPAAPQGASRSTSPGARRAGAGCPQSPAPSPPGPD